MQTTETTNTKITGIFNPVKFLFLKILLLLVLASDAQDIKRTANWYFGRNAGLNFNTNPPTPLTDGAMNTVEGCATISDTNGNLLFYTNGEKIWNKTHQVMENGSGLLGDWDATQSAIIIPQPNNDSLFYVFTTDAVGQAAGLQYNIVNSNANSGLGKVIIKNVQLQTPVCEKLTATHHENGRDIWVMAHGFGNNYFYAYLITPEGIVNCPVISKIGSEHYLIESLGIPHITNAQGAMKFSPDGKLLAITVFGGDRIELFKFSKNTGQITDLIANLDSISLAYSLEFSPNQEYLYTGDKGKNVYQYLLNISPAQINSTKKVVYTHSSDAVQGLQMGSDKKIYQAVIQASFVAIINRPDSLGDSSLYAYNGFNLGGKRSEYDLPNFITSYFYNPDFDFTYQTNCSGNIYTFREKASVPVTARSWQIYKGSTLIASSTLPYFNVNLQDTGTFTICYIANTTDTVVKQAYLDAPLLPTRDTAFCNRNVYTVNLPSTYRCVMWQDGSDTSNYTITQAGTYTVSAYNTRGCYITDSIKINFKTLNKPNIQRQGDSLYTDSTALTYEWLYNNIPVEKSNTQGIRIWKTGAYKVVVSDTALGCSDTSTVIQITSLSAKETALLSFKIYPNPSTGKVFIQTDLQNYSITITNLMGQTVYQQPQATGNTEIDITTGGIYFIQVQDYLGNTLIKKQMITR